MSYSTFSFFSEYEPQLLILENSNCILLLEDVLNEVDDIGDAGLGANADERMAGARVKPSKTPANRNKKNVEETPPPEEEMPGATDVGHPMSEPVIAPTREPQRKIILQRPKGIRPSVLLKNASMFGRGERVKKAIEECRTRPPIVTETVDGYDKIFWNFKCFPSAQMSRHWGYIIYDPKNKLILKIFCDCKDFHYRLLAPFVKNKLATWKADDPLAKRQLPHNHKFTVKTNPKGVLFACKHAAACFIRYLPK